MPNNLLVNCWLDERSFLDFDAAEFLSEGTLRVVTCIH